jgi:hypothetical protein
MTLIFCCNFSEKCLSPARIKQNATLYHMAPLVVGSECFKEFEMLRMFINASYRAAGELLHEKNLKCNGALRVPNNISRQKKTKKRNNSKKNNSRQSALNSNL